MTKLSFDIIDSKALFNKLTEDYKEYNDDSISSRAALNCAMTAWHLVEWVYNEFYSNSNIFKNLAVFKNYLKLQCPALQIMQDLTNGTKHHTINSYRSEIESTKLHLGDFNDDFSSDYDISILEIEMKDGTLKYFEDEIESVYEFWKNFLEENHNIKS